MQTEPSYLIWDAQKKVLMRAEPADQMQPSFFLRALGAMHAAHASDKPGLPPGGALRAADEPESDGFFRSLIDITLGSPQTHDRFLEPMV